jgi:hypothetical protein
MLRCGWQRIARRNPTGAKTMLVVDSEADPQGALAAAALPGTYVMVYNSAIDSTEDVVSKIEAAYKANGGAPLTSIAFANHAGEVWQLASDCICHPGQDGCITDASPVISALARCVAKEGGRIDLLGCRLLALDPHLPDKLEKEFEGIQFTASDDDTGNRSAGGDWVMESDGIDISADYFDATRLKAYTDTMNSAASIIAIFNSIGMPIPHFLLMQDIQERQAAERARWVVHGSSMMSLVR